MAHGFTVPLTFNFVFNLYQVKEEVLVFLDLVSCNLDPHIGKGQLVCASLHRHRLCRKGIESKTALAHEKSLNPVSFAGPHFICCQHNRGEF